MLSDVPVGSVCGWGEAPTLSFANFAEQVHEIEKKICVCVWGRRGGAGMPPSRLDEGTVRLFLLLS